MKKKGTKQKGSPPRISYPRSGCTRSPQCHHEKHPRSTRLRHASCDPSDPASCQWEEGQSPKPGIRISWSQCTFPPEGEGQSGHGRSQPSGALPQRHSCTDGEDDQHESKRERETGGESGIPITPTDGVFGRLEILIFHKGVGSATRGDLQVNVGNLPVLHKKRKVEK